MFGFLALASVAAAADERVIATQYIRITRVQNAAAAPTSFANGTAATNGTLTNGTAPSNGTASNSTATNGTSGSNSTSSPTTSGAANGAGFTAPQLAAVAIGAAALLI